MTDPIIQRLYQSRAKILKSLAHPTRAYLADILSEKERCVCELAELAGADISTVSKHLSVLRNAGIIEARKEGLQVFYALRAPCILNFFECVEAVQDLDLKDLAARKKALRVLK